MKPAIELAACKQALAQYRRAWRELGAALRARTEPPPWAAPPPFDILAEIGRKHNLPPAHDQHDDMPNNAAQARKAPEAAGSASFEQKRDEWAQAYAKDACRLLGLAIHPKNYNPIACIIKSADDHRPNASAQGRPTNREDVP